MPYPILKAAIHRIHALEEDEYQLFESGCTPKSFGRKEYLLRSGQTARGVYFILEGAIGKYTLQDGKEIFEDFFFEGEFATDVASLTQQQQSEYYLMALESTEVLYAPREHLLQLYEIKPNFLNFGRKMLTELLVEKMRFSSLHTRMTARERYEKVRDEQPRLLQRVPLQYLCSYLGMTRETLSRVRRGA